MENDHIVGYLVREATVDLMLSVAYDSIVWESSLLEQREQPLSLNVQ